MGNIKELKITRKYTLFSGVRWSGYDLHVYIPVQEKCY